MYKHIIIGTMLSVYNIYTKAINYKEKRNSSVECLSVTYSWAIPIDCNAAHNTLGLVRPSLKFWNSMVIILSPICISIIQMPYGLVRRSPGGKLIWFPATNVVKAFATIWWCIAASYLPPFCGKWYAGRGFRKVSVLAFSIGDQSAVVTRGLLFRLFLNVKSDASKHICDSINHQHWRPGDFKVCCKLPHYAWIMMF